MRNEHGRRYPGLLCPSGQQVSNIDGYFVKFAGIRAVWKSTRGNGLMKNPAEADIG